MSRGLPFLALCLATGLTGLASAAEVAVLKGSEVAAWRPALDELIGRQAAELVNRIAAGEPGKYELLFPNAALVSNKRIADKLGISIPAEALAGAQKLF